MSILLGEKYDNPFKAIPHYHLIITKSINANGIVQNEFPSICLHVYINSISFSKAKLNQMVCLYWMRCNKHI